VADLRLTPAVIKVLDKASIDGGNGLQETMAVQINPTQYELQKGAQIAEIGIPGLDSPILQFIRGQTEKLTLELMFDTADQGMDADATDVRTLTRPFYELVKIQPKTHAPPRVQVSWGLGLSFKAIVESITQKFLLFSPSGLPLRATLTMVFRGYRTLKEQVEELKLESSNFTTQCVVKAHQSLASIANDEYGDPQLWRHLADANPGVDVREPAPGTVLKVPPLDAFAEGAA
jgi:hypothetical protein